MQAKNEALKDAGAVVPDSFEAFEGAIKETYDKLVAEANWSPSRIHPRPACPSILKLPRRLAR